MKATAAILDLSTLPEEARQEITDFYQFLKKKYRNRKKCHDAPIINGTATLNETGFIGIWKDRTDMSDSAGWVRQQRISTWSRHE